MAYGLIRVKELSAKEVKAADIHNARKFKEYDKPYPPNIKQNEEYYAAYWRLGNGYHHYYDSVEQSKTNLSDVVNARILDANVKEKANSVQALEFVCSASADVFEKYDARAYFARCDKWLCNRYGEANVVARYDHFDETTPHVHFIVVPIVQKEVKWKNQKGEGTKIENRLCARDLTGNKKLLEQLQDDYFEFTSNFFASRGITIHRGTKAAEQKRVYTRETNHELGELRAKLREVDKIIEETNKSLKNGLISPEKGIEIIEQKANEVKRIEAERKVIEDKMQKINDELSKKIEKHDKKNEKDGWKQGRDFGKLF